MKKEIERVKKEIERVKKEIEKVKNEIESEKQIYRIYLDKEYEGKDANNVFHDEREDGERACEEERER